MIGMWSPKELVQQSCNFYLIWTAAQILEHLLEFQTILVIIFRDFLMFYQFFFTTSETNRDY